jgi:hypothetical protein
MNWTADSLLAHVQDLLGEGVGDFYNISTRLNLMNHAQDEMLEETRALTSTTTLTTVSGTQTVALPSDFLTFSTEQPVYITAGGDYYPLTVQDVGDIDRMFPNWQDSTEYPASSGPPTDIWVTNHETLNMLPLPDGGDVNLRYVPSATLMTDYSDVPFNGNTRLNRFAVGLAYKVANTIMLPRNPELASVYQRMYIAELRKLRHHARSNPQRGMTIKPQSRRS